MSPFKPALAHCSRLCKLSAAHRRLHSRRPPLLWLHLQAHTASAHAWPHLHLAGFVDVDEYIILRADIPSLPELLQRYEQFGGLALFSKIFGTNGHKTRPAGGTRQGFTKCAPAMQVRAVSVGGLVAGSHSAHACAAAVAREGDGFRQGCSLHCPHLASCAFVVCLVPSKFQAQPAPAPLHPQKEYYKTIANLHYVLPTIGKFGPHAFRMRDGAKTVNSRGLTVISGESERVVKDEIFLHHYWTRSEEEFAAKLQRGGGIHKTNRFNTGHMTFVDTTCTLDCLDAVRYTSDSEGAQ